MATDNVLIKVRGLEKSFQSGTKKLEVLKGIDFTIRTGEMMAVCGASGVGKSTFLHILGTLERPTAGQVLYGEKDIFSLDNGALSQFRNRDIGFVFQFHHLLPEFTAMENVIMPHLIAGASRRACLARGREQLAEVGLEDRAEHKPGELSGGEQQRVAIARALCMNPKIVFADEPTGNLDTTTGESVHELLKEINRKQNVTFVLATHNEDLARKSDRIVQMVDGKIAG
ncbi:MAG: ABC transporter ATP-binding protein [Deltaproteobacteria bacterium]|nr:ABC transporter ATP-binding protein [Deltaproteobacteria bacterium]